MNVVLYSTDKADHDAASLETHIREIVSKEFIHTYRRIHDLGERLKDPREATDIAVLVANNEQELNEFEELREELKDIRIILVLPADDSRMVLKGHGLRPRFLTFADTSPEIVGSVVERMMATVKR